MRFMKYFITLLLCLAVLSCNYDDTEEYEFVPITPVDYSEQNEMEINEYLTRNNLVSQTSETGLHYIIENPGEGVQPDIDANVTIQYKGYLLDDSFFDESPEEGLTADVATFIKGFREGITYLKEGGNGTFFIPAHLGFGINGYQLGITESTVLIFEVQLVSVN